MIYAAGFIALAASTDDIYARIICATIALAYALGHIRAWTTPSKPSSDRPTAV